MPVKNSNIDFIKEIEAKFCPTYNKIIYVTYTFMLIFLTLIVTSLIKIEKISCKCANIPEKRFIKEWFIFSIIFNLIVLFSFLISDKACYFYIKNETLPYIAISLVSFISLIMGIRLLVYLNILRKGCKCGYGKLEKFLFWYLLTIFSILALFILFMIVIGVFSMIKMFNN